MTTASTNSSTPQALPSWDKQAKESKRDLDRQEKFRQQANKPVPWHQNMRLGNGRVAGYDYLNLEALYKGFRQRLCEDPAFEQEILELVMDRIMAELYVPLNHRPQAGLKLSICRKPINGAPDGDN